MQLRTLRASDIPALQKLTVGFDSMFEDLERAGLAQTNYPPYNVIQHDEDHYDIEIAVAGFREGDIDITLEKNILTIKGEITEGQTDEKPKYLHKGISSRSFTRQFTLAEHVEVLNASCENGILTIELERQVPVDLQPKNIAITYKG